jgi:hypothetical protein
MCERVTRIFHQTFRNGDATKTSQKFSFQRIYKTRTNQHFRLKLMGVTGGQHSVDTQNLIFLKGIPELTTFCSFTEIDTARKESKKCDMYLGNLNDRDYLDLEIIVDEVPMTPFTISCDVACQFSVTFQIELIE